MKSVFNPYDLEHIAIAMQWLKDIQIKRDTPYPFQVITNSTKKKKKRVPTQGLLKGPSTKKQ